MDLPAEDFARASFHLDAAKYFQIAAFVMLIYDHALTFGQEVERVWKQQFSGVTLLFLLNRYLTPLQFIIIIEAFHDPQWSKEACLRFVAFEGASTVAMVAVCELVMILRVYALYARNNWVLAVLMTIWTGQVIVSSVGISAGFPAPLPPGLVGCIFTSTSSLFPSLWVAPLVTDTFIFLLTLARTRTYNKLINTAPTLQVFLRDGSLYFLIIFLANLMNTVIYFVAPEDLKAIGASFSHLITTTIVSRLVLNLRSLGSTNEKYDTTQLRPVSASYTDTFRRDRMHGTTSSFLTRTVQNFGIEDQISKPQIMQLEVMQTRHKVTMVDGQTV